MIRWIFAAGWVGLIACSPTPVDHLPPYNQVVMERDHYRGAAERAQAMIFKKADEAYRQGVKDGAAGVKCIPKWAPVPKNGH